MTSRRAFLLSAGAAALAACTPDAPPPPPPGEFHGPAPELGHRLRGSDFPPPSSTRRAHVVIVGGGISGLSAAWRLARAAVDDVLVLEMAAEAGGNSRSGQSPLTAYPWGAHYLPLPGPEAVWVRELLAELGVLQGSPTARKPRYDERYLCATPQERLYRDGLWEEGLLPQRGLAAGERAQQQRFHEMMDDLKRRRGRDGRRLFALPMALSSRDPAWRSLDRLSFRQWLDDAGFTAPSLRWLTDYACRDDYGTLARDTSAWAGLHYFACRDGEALDATGDTVLTAPEGNAWLVRGLARPLAGRVLTDALAWRIEAEKATVAVDVFRNGKTERLTARHLIWAAPAFLLPRVWRNMPGRLRQAALAGDYAPWLVANLHLAGLPEERRGAPPAWDNVLHDSPGLGYVVATHQHLRRHQPGTVFTYYRALSASPPALARQQLLTTPHADWAAQILAELERAHPDLRRHVTRLDISRNAHAMRRPTPGSLFHGQRELLADFHHPHVTLAHADLSGFSLFEEAQDRGVRAAERVLGVR